MRRNAIREHWSSGLSAMVTSAMLDELQIDANAIGAPVLMGDVEGSDTK